MIVLCLVILIIDTYAVSFLVRDAIDVWRGKIVS